jgi:hypothetical protein
MWVTAFRDEGWEIFAESFVGATAEVKLRAVNMLGGRRLIECVYVSSECTRVGSNRVEVGTARVGLVTEPTVRREYFLVKRSQLGGAKSYVDQDFYRSMRFFV